MLLLLLVLLVLVLPLLLLRKIVVLSTEKPANKMAIPQAKIAKNDPSPGSGRWARYIYYSHE